MANLKEIKNRIATVASTEQTTSAMKMISASKLRKVQTVLQSLRPYSQKLHSAVLHTVQDGDTISHSEFLQPRKVERVLLMVVTSNSGLCGAFNTLALKSALYHIRSYYLTNPDIKEISIMCFGKKAVEFFAKHDYKVVANHIDFMNHLNRETCNTLAEDLLKAYKDGTYDLIDLVSNVFVNAGNYQTAVFQKLPYNIEETVPVQHPTHDHYIYEPHKSHVIQTMVPMSFKARLYLRFADSLAAEYAARMTAMHKATENAVQLQKELKLRYNKARQAAITNEIIEIINSANALNAVK